MFMDPIIHRIVTQTRFKTPVAQFVKIAVHKQVQAATVRTSFQKAVHAPHNIQKLELVNILSASKRSLLSTSSLSDEKKKSRRRKMSRCYFKLKLKKSTLPSSGNVSSSSPSSHRSYHSISDLLPVNERFRTDLEYRTHGLNDRLSDYSERVAKNCARYQKNL